MYKLYILVRKDLNCSVGKLCVHVGHTCSTMVFKHMDRVIRSIFYDKDINKRFNDWYNDGKEQTKILLGVENLKELKKYYDKSTNIFKCYIEDAGYYEVPKGTIVCCCVGILTDKEAEGLGLKKIKLFKK